MLWTGALGLSGAAVELLWSGAALDLSGTAVGLPWIQWSCSGAALDPSWAAVGLLWASVRVQWS